MPKYFPCFLRHFFILAFTKTLSAKTEKKVNKKTQHTTHKTQLLVAERDIWVKMRLEGQWSKGGAKWNFVSWPQRMEASWRNAWKIYSEKSRGSTISNGATFLLVSLTDLKNCIYEFFRFIFKTPCLHHA